MPPIVIPDNFKKVMLRKQNNLQAAILECVEQLGNDPSYPALKVHRVRSKPGVWEAYVDRANRVTFEWDQGTIVLRNNCNHDIIERSP